MEVSLPSAPKTYSWPVLPTRNLFVGRLSSEADLPRSGCSEANIPKLGFLFKFLFVDVGYGFFSGICDRRARNLMAIGLRCSALQPASCVLRNLRCQSTYVTRQVFQRNDEEQFFFGGGGY